MIYVKNSTAVLKAFTNILQGGIFMSKKVFVLRTHALLSSRKSTLKFGDDNEIVIPLCVVDEIKSIRKESFEKGRIARDLLEYINSFPTSKLMSENGVVQENESILRISKNFNNIKVEIENLTSSEKRTLQTCLGIMMEEKKTVILVTNNLSLQLKAKALGIKAESLKDEVFPRFSEQYTGRKEVIVSDEIIDGFYKKGFVNPEEIFDNVQSEEIYENQFFLMKSYLGKSAIGKYKAGVIKPLDFQGVYPYGVKAKNLGQKYILEALLDDDIPLVIIKGSAGTGKTFCTLAVGLERSFNENSYSRILVTRSVTATEQYGFLPGDIEEKLSPYLAGIKDNLSILCNNSNKESQKVNKYEFSDSKPQKENGEFFFERGIIQIQAIGFLRGRSIVDTFFIIDETQNIEPDTIKSIVTRAGEGSKFIFLGDPTQIDNPNLTERYNGLVYLSEKMKGNPMCAQVTLPDEESVRSDLAREAAKIL